MSENIITSDGLLSAPGTSNAFENEDKMEVSYAIANDDDLLGKSDNDEQIPPSQVPRKPKQPKQQRRDRRPQRSTSEPRTEQYRKRRQFARMRLMYIFQGENNEPYPYHVKSTWEPPIQQSVALESYLEEVKIDLAEIEIKKPKNNLPPAERGALRTLKRDTEINLKKADKGTTTVVMNTQDKIKEGQTLLDNKDNYRPLASPMVTETNQKVKQLITDLHNGDHIEDMTKKWLCQTPNTLRIPEFYTLTKIHKPSPVGRPIVSGCDGPTEKLSSFVDKLLQPTSRYYRLRQFHRKYESPSIYVILVTMDVTSLYTNIPQEEGIDTVCRAYEIFYRNEPPIPTQLLKRAFRPILQENSFQFNWKKLPSNTWYGHGHENGSRLF